MLIRVGSSTDTIIVVTGCLIGLYPGLPETIYPQGYEFVDTPLRACGRFRFGQGDYELQVPVTVLVGFAAFPHPTQPTAYAHIAYDPSCGGVLTGSYARRSFPAGYAGRIWREYTIRQVTGRRESTVQQGSGKYRAQSSEYNPRTGCSNDCADSCGYGYRDRHFPYSTGTVT